MFWWFLLNFQQRTPGKNGHISEDTASHRSFARDIFGFQMDMCLKWALSREVLALIDEHEGKSAKEIQTALETLEARIDRSKVLLKLKKGICHKDLKVQLSVCQFSPGITARIGRSKLNCSSVENELFALTDGPHQRTRPKVKPLFLEENAAESNTGPPAWACFLSASSRDYVDGVALLIESEVDTELAMLDAGATPSFITDEGSQVKVVGLMIKAQADLDKALTNDGATALFIAAQDGYVEVVDLFIRARADINKARTVDGAAPLFIAAEKDRVEVVDLLIKAGADIDKVLTSAEGQMEAGAESEEALAKAGATALFIAAQNGNVEVVGLLIKAGADIDKTRTVDGAAPLFVAAQLGYVNVVDLLLKAGADINKALTNGGEAWWFMKGQRQAGADFDRPCAGATALFIAAQNGHVEVVDLLIKKGADINKGWTSTEATPLFIAAQQGHVEVVGALIEAGAALDKALANAGATCLLMKGQVKVGADIHEALTSAGATALFIAARNGNVEVVGLLIKAGADIDKARTVDGATPLFVAAQLGHANVVDLLLKAGADINKGWTSTGATPLFIAAQLGHVEVVDLLIKARADIDKARTLGAVAATPLDIASRNCHVEVVALLKKAEMEKSCGGARQLFITAQLDIQMVRLLGGGNKLHL